MPKPKPEIEVDDESPTLRMSDADRPVERDDARDSLHEAIAVVTEAGVRAARTASSSKMKAARR